MPGHGPLSWLTRIRPESAAMRSTSGSFKPARLASASVRISISGTARRSPRRDAPVQIGISLESDSHCAPAGALQSIRHWFVAIAGVATPRCGPLPQGMRQFLFCSQGKTQGLHALARASKSGSSLPYPPPTSLRGRNRSTNRGNSRIPHSISAFDLRYVFLLHSTVANLSSHVEPRPHKAMLWNNSV